MWNHQQIQIKSSPNTYWFIRKYTFAHIHLIKTQLVFTRMTKILALSINIHFDNKLVSRSFNQISNSRHKTWTEWNGPHGNFFGKLSKVKTFLEKNLYRRWANPEGDFGETEWIQNFPCRKTEKLNVLAIRRKPGCPEGNLRKSWWK